MRKIFGLALAVLLLGNSVEAAQVQGNPATFKDGGSWAQKAEENSKTYNECYSRGVAYAEGGKPQQAIEEFSKMIEIMPENSDGYRLRSWAYDLAGKPALALADINIAIEKSSSPIADDYQCRGRLILFSGGTSEQVMENISEAIKILPDNAEFYQMRAILYRSAKKYDLALQDMDNLIKKTSSPTAEQYWLRGNISRSSNDFEGALRDYAKAIEIDPDYTMAYTSRIILYKKMKDYDLAFAEVDALSKRYSTLREKAYCHSLRGGIAEEINDFEGAIKEYSKAFEADSKYRSALEARFNIYRKTKKYDLALLDLDALIETTSLPASKSSYYRQRGDIMRELGNDKAALEDYTKAIEVTPTDYFYYQIRADFYRRTKKYDLALKDINVFIEKTSSPEAYCYWLKGAILEGNGDQAGALASYTQAIEKDPTYTSAYLYRADLYRKAKKYDLALLDINAAIEKTSSPTAYYYWLRGDILEKSIKREAAIADYTKALEIDPNYMRVYRARSSLYMWEEKYNLALADINLEIEKSSVSSPYSYWLRGEILEKMGDKEKAIQDFSKAIEIDTTYTLAYRSRAIIYEGMKKYDLALSDIDALIKYPSSVGSQSYNCLWRGHILTRIENYEEALKEYTRAIEFYPDNVFAYESRSRVYGEIGEHELALADVDTIIKKASSPNSKHNVLRGKTLLKSGDKEGAIREYNKAIEIDTDDIFAYLERISFYEQEEKYDFVLKDYEILILKNPNSAGWHYQRAKIYYKMKLMDLAIKDLEKARKLSPKRANSAYLLGEIYEIQYKDKEKALVYYRLVLESDSPKSEKEIIQKAEEAIQRLEGQ